MLERPHDPGQYLLRVANDLRRYTQDLLDENARLRRLEAARRVEDERIAQRRTAAQEALAIAERLRDRIDELEFENAQLLEDRGRLSSQLEAARAALGENERETVRLSCRLDRTDAENRRFAEEFAVLERENNNLTNLYVASCRLHASVERHEVVGVLQEILANLVGSEEMAVLELNGRGSSLALVGANGIDPDPFRALPLGIGVIGRVAADGETFVRDGSLPPEATAAEADLTACIPLRLGDRVAGVVAVFRLLPQKPGIEDLDREIFELLATHAATALCLSELRGGGQDVSTRPMAGALGNDGPFTTGLAAVRR